MNTPESSSGGAEVPAATSALPYQGTGAVPPDAPYEERQWPEGPRWRTFAGGPCLPQPPDDDEADRRLGPDGAVRSPSAEEVRLVNAAILLRRPLLVTGRPGVGKSTLAYRIARELRLGRVLQWPVTSRTTLASGLFEYDVIGRAQAGQAWYAARQHSRPADGSDEGSTASCGEDRVDIGEFIQIGPLGTALLPHRLPRVLLIDELDKGDADLPNDLLTLFEDGWYTVPPLVRVKRRSPEVTVHTADPGRTAPIVDGIVTARSFPIVIMTSNGEREFPEAFMRRCLRFDIPDPGPEALGELVAAHFADQLGDMHDRLVRDFMTRSEQVHGLAADQLLNAAHLATSGAYTPAEGDGAEWQALLGAIWHPLSTDVPADGAEPSA
ncbi:MoxR family ATPase [Streptomyces sp. NPDC005970]|uniref:AAA family ATPase n=1 Tax=Streptomyces sp. NPDC005970 TaxID=3156723 RepID=UPI0033DEA533